MLNVKQGSSEYQLFKYFSFILLMPVLARFSQLKLPILYNSAVCDSAPSRMASELFFDTFNEQR